MRSSRCDMLATVLRRRDVKEFVAATASHLNVDNDVFYRTPSAHDELIATD
ncbi:hypothetical protein ACFVUW_11285 [Streptomyces xiamenensis]|uniref:hypothetical protein n=1 Tax=Streptomyces xiamenensis TaxID=408015 RepID=UPI0036EA0B7A